MCTTHAYSTHVYVLHKLKPCFCVSVDLRFILITFATQNPTDNNISLTPNKENLHNADKENPRSSPSNAKQSNTNNEPARCGIVSLGYWEADEHVIALVLRSGAAAAERASRPGRHARQTSLVTSRPARRNRETGRAAQQRRPASGRARRSGGRAAGRPRRATSTYRGRRLDAAARAGPGAGTEHAASGATERGRRCSERSSLRAPAPPPPAPPRPPRRLSHAPKRPIYLPRMLALLPEDVAQGASSTGLG